VGSSYVKYITGIILYCFLCGGCATIAEPVFQFDQLSVPSEPSPEPAYRPNLAESFTKTEKPAFLEQNGRLCFSGEEFKKILVLNKQYNSLLNIAEAQVNLVNSYIRRLNSQQQMTYLKSHQLKETAELYEAAENRYRAEKKAHRTDNLINKIGWYLLEIGAVVLLVASL